MIPPFLCLYKFSCTISLMIYIYIYIYRFNGREGRVFANDLESMIIPKTLKMVLDTALLNTQQYNVSIKGKVEQSKERSSALPYTSV